MESRETTNTSSPTETGAQFANGRREAHHLRHRLCRLREPRAPHQPSPREAVCSGDCPCPGASRRIHHRRCREIRSADPGLQSREEVAVACSAVYHAATQPTQSDLPRPSSRGPCLLAVAQPNPRRQASLALVDGLVSVALLMMAASTVLGETMIDTTTTSSIGMSLLNERVLQASEVEQPTTSIRTATTRTSWLSLAARRPLDRGQCRTPATM